MHLGSILPSIWARGSPRHYPQRGMREGGCPRRRGAAGGRASGEEDSDEENEDTGEGKPGGPSAEKKEIIMDDFEEDYENGDGGQH